MRRRWYQNLLKWTCVCYSIWYAFLLWVWADMDGRDWVVNILGLIVPQRFICKQFSLKAFSSTSLLWLGSVLVKLTTRWVRPSSFSQLPVKVIYYGTGCLFHYLGYMDEFLLGNECRIGKLQKWAKHLISSTWREIVRKKKSQLDLEFECHVNTFIEFKLFLVFAWYHRL